MAVAMTKRHPKEGVLCAWDMAKIQNFCFSHICVASQNELTHQFLLKSAQPNF